MAPGASAEPSPRILVVDDNLDHVQLATRALRAASAAWRVEAARLGREALDKLAHERFDLVLLDYRLPDMSGLDVLRQLRQASAVPVILMSSQGSEEVAILALDAGANAYLVKSSDFGRRLAFEAGEWLARGA